MPKIMRDCAFCGRQISIYVDEDGDILSDAFFMGVGPTGQERWACNACQRSAETTPKPPSSANLPEPISPMDELEMLPNPIDSDFCQWFSGWTDARGRFGLHFQESRYVWIYETQTNADEKRTLEHIHKHLGFGRIVPKPQHISPATHYRFIAQDREDVEVLMVVFAHFALQNPQREAQFQVWCEAFEFDRKQKKLDASYLKAMHAYDQRLAKLEKAQPAPHRKTRPRQQRDSSKEPTLFDVS